MPRSATTRAASGSSRSIPSLRNAETATLLQREVYEVARFDPKRALGFAMGSVAVARGLGDPAVLAESIRAKANVLHLLNENRAAVEHHDQALALLEPIGDQDQIARTLSASILPLNLLGEYDRAFAAAARAREIYRATGNQWRLARLEVNEGNVYFRLDRFAEALACYQRAYPVLVEQQDVEAAGTLGNMASALISLGDHRRALDSYVEARALSERRGMTHLVALADYNIAYLHFLRGEYNRAIELLRQSRRAAETVGDDYQYALCQMDLAEIYLEVNLGEEAAEVAQDAHARFERMGLGYEAARSLAFRAIAAGQLGRAEQALALLIEARSAFSVEGNAPWVALIDLYRALDPLQREPAGRSEADSASRHSTTSAIRSRPTRLCSAGCCWRGSTSAPASASRRSRSAGARSSGYETLDAPTLAFQANLLHGQVLLAMGEQEPAYQAFQNARAALESAARQPAQRGAQDRVRRQPARGLRASGGALPGARLDQRGLAEAFAYMEQAKSRSLIDLVFQPLQSLAAADLGQSEAARAIRTLREELNWYYSLIERERLRPERGSAQRIAELQESAEVRERGLLRQLRELRAEDAEYASLHAPTTVPMATIQEALPEGALLVEYFRIDGPVRGRAGDALEPRDPPDRRRRGRRRAASPAALPALEVPARRGLRGRVSGRPARGHQRAPPRSSTGS